MEENNGLKMEQCFLCLKTLEDISPGSFDKIKAFKILLRYLDIDISKLGGSEASHGTREKVNFSFCDECSPLISDFHEWYKNLNFALFGLNECVKGVLDIIEADGLCQGRDQEDNKISTVTKVLREETRRQCHVKIRSSSAIQPESIPISQSINKPTENSEENNVRKYVDGGPMTPYKEREFFKLSHFQLSNEPISINNWNPAVPFNSTTTLGNIPEMRTDTEETLPGPFQSSILACGMRKLKKINRFTCNFCDYEAKKNNEIKEHSMRKHAFQLYSNKLPPSATEDELELAIRDIVTSPEVIPGCDWCSQGFSRRDRKRFHILKNHFTQILQILQKGSAPQGKPQPNGISKANKISVDIQTFYKCNFCEFTSAIKRDVSVHMGDSHMVQSLNGKVPLEVTEGELKVVMNKILNMASTQSYISYKGTGIHQYDVFVCPYCHCSTVKDEGRPQLQLHILEVHIDKILEVLRITEAKCTGADNNHEKTITKTVTQQVKLRVHGEEGLQKCRYCPNLFEGWELVCHMKCVHTAIFYRNSLPQKITDEMFEITIHSFIKCAPGITSYLCDLCNNTFYTMRDTKKHLMEEHKSAVIEKLKAASLPLNENHVDVDCQQKVRNKGPDSFAKPSAGVNARQFEDAVQEVLSKARVLYKDTNGIQKGYVGCFHCPLDFEKRSQLRRHILWYHYEQIVFEFRKE